jgi:hypothetical protein
VDCAQVLSSPSDMARTDKKSKNATDDEELIGNSALMDYVKTTDMPPHPQDLDMLPRSVQVAKGELQQNVLGQSGVNVGGIGSEESQKEVTGENTWMYMTVVKNCSWRTVGRIQKSQVLM